MTSKPIDASGEVLQGYLLESLLGRGGMGTVYAARHQRLDRRVAIKVLADELTASSDYVSRFLQEAKVVNSIRHPHIVDITDFIETESPRRVAYVMEFLGGPPLGELLKNHTLSVNAAVGIARQMISALRAVHAVGVVHRDLKPDNIMLVKQPPPDLSHIPNVKILDFGIAKDAKGDADHKTATGMVLGTPAYMAPEQIAAEPVSPATDVYALAEIFYELVAGRRAYIGNPTKILKAKLTGRLPELELPPGTPGADLIQGLVRRCLVVEREERPTLEAFADGLDQILAAPTVGGASTLIAPIVPTPGEPTLTPRDMSSMIAMPEQKASSPTLPIAAGVVVLLAASVAGFAYHRSQQDVVVTSFEVPAKTERAESAAADAGVPTDAGAAEARAPVVEKPVIEKPVVKKPVVEKRTARKPRRRTRKKSTPPPVKKTTVTKKKAPTKPRSKPVKKGELVPW